MMKMSRAFWVGLNVFMLLLLPACSSGSDYRDLLGTPAQLSRRELLLLASRIGAESREQEPDGKTDPTVLEILKVEGRPELYFVVVMDQWCQGHGRIVDIEGRTIEGFYPGQYRSVSQFSSNQCEAGTHIRITYTTARGNFAGCDELIFQPDNTIQWLTKVQQ